MEIHLVPGKGFSEIVYKDALDYECGTQNIFYERDDFTSQIFADFVVFDSVIVEVKSKKELLKIIMHRC